MIGAWEVEHNNKLSQESAPVLEALERMKTARLVPFDVPGHKRGRGNPELTAFLGEKCLSVDVNSMKMLDNLCHPVSVIRDAERLAAEAFGAAHAFFMIGGTTSAVQAMILTAAGRGDEIILPRNVHRSVINAMILCGATPVYVDPGMDKRLGIALGIGSLAGSILTPILSQGKVSFRDYVGYFGIFVLGLGIYLLWQTLPMARAKKQKANEAARQYTRELITHHVSGRLKVAPEHISDRVLRLMRKPSFEQFYEFKRIFDRINKEEGLKEQIIPYFISSHPGCQEEDMAELAVITKALDFHLEQVQDFTPTPMTVSTETWYTGYDPYTLEPVFSAKTPREKLAQRQFFFWYRPEERQAIECELRRIGRSDLIKKLYNGTPFHGHVHYDSKAIGSTPKKAPHQPSGRRDRNQRQPDNRQPYNVKANGERRYDDKPYDGRRNNERRNNDKRNGDKRNSDQRNGDKRKSFNPNFTPNGNFKGRRR